MQDYVTLKLLRIIFKKVKFIHQGFIYYVNQLKLIRDESMSFEILRILHEMLHKFKHKIKYITFTEDHFSSNTGTNFRNFYNFKILNAKLVLNISVNCNIIM